MDRRSRVKIPNMNNANIKITLNNFEYFLANIQPDIKIKKICDKISGMVNLESDITNLILELNDFFDINQLAELLEELKVFCKTVNIDICAIKYNKFTNFDECAGIKVIRLNNNPSKNVSLYKKSLIVNDPVRGGVTIQNHGDIIITSFVADGADIIATGSIHVYGNAKGRLIAGTNGDRTAQIFVMNFNSSLISIAGIYRILDGDLPSNIINKSVRIFLDDKDRLNIFPLL